MDWAPVALMALLAGLVAFALFQAGRIVIGIALGGLRRDRSGAAGAFARSLGAYEERLATMPAPEAARAAEAILAGSPRIRVSPAASPTVTSELSPSLRAFFARFRRVEAHRGEPYVDAAAIDACPQAPGFLSLGMADGHTYIAARPHQDPVYFVADDVPAATAIEVTLPTIHHWVLWLDESERLLGGGAGEGNVQR